ncbi:MAG: hypothetical protein A3E00_14300 [Curvibacter sp. RIFCSPHIGHO2_12_FULL_63_18]|uniref:DUF6463 family protein n=1 Tax=Rhodoferax sp. TaxID=50421 RepID=UPI0008BBBEF1|nr:DUF6463 family protein [Rhodoferax sp.]OGO94919.1 MAG: hypothetical protein A2037_11810 [Curvibacter sp. GWA2_63_95]OGP01361.1 MAG: hypothetical protein A3E00_14300 [Curvibacter sp. RIFCSPHIGHO2_12_FULL_63_18]HCX82239.1 hypothetical protein [Rhodoferax sp.]
MAHTAAWFLVLLGLGHIAYGLRKYHAPLRAAWAGGFIGQFGATEERRTAFWFLILGPLLVLAGHAALHAVATGDLALLKIVGGYLLFTGVLGAAAFPKSPFWAALPTGPLLIATGYGWLSL